MADADRLGKIWVGEGARQLSDGSGWISSDGTRVYRSPAVKESSRHAVTGVQANFERYSFDSSGNKVRISNGHLDVVGGVKP